MFVLPVYIFITFLLSTLYCMLPYAHHYLMSDCHVMCFAFYAENNLHLNYELIKVRCQILISLFKVTL